MERREDVLRQALITNADETERWTKYQKDNETAVENLDAFSKHLTINVLVPIGKKAYMQGYLVHTSEALVGHYQGYFSSCCSYKAKEICQHRIVTAQKHLEQLAIEADLWQNKLIYPHREGVLPNAQESEIIEQYDEVVEAKWRRLHKIRIKEEKLAERQKREESTKHDDRDRGAEKGDEEIFRLLAEAELMEELEAELNALEVDEVNDETIRRLMLGEMKLPIEKARRAHSTNENAKTPHDTLKGVVKKNELNANTNQVSRTNNNVCLNPDIVVTATNDAQSEFGILEELPEVQVIKNQAKYLTEADQIGFYEYQIEILQQRLFTAPLRNPEEINEKIRLHQVLDELEELLEMAESTVGANELAKEEESENGSNEATPNTQELLHKKRRISFASEDQTLEFCKNEAVTQMLPKAASTSPHSNKKALNRDVIRLDSPLDVQRPEQDKSIVVECKRMQNIHTRMENHLEYVTRDQSAHDFDMVNKILAPSLGGIRTLSIAQFKHSAPAERKEEADLLSASVPATPAGIYRMYLAAQRQQPDAPATIFLNGYKGEESVKSPVLREAHRQHAYVDPRTEFSKPITNSKSILRNKVAASEDPHHVPKTTKPNTNKKKKIKTSTKIDEGEYMSAYNKVMHEVVEKPLVEPDPLPERYIDAHAPKQRVSRFKQMRAGAQKT